MLSTSWTLGKGRRFNPITFTSPVPKSTHRFITYTFKWFCEDIFKPGFLFNNYVSDFNYKIPEGFDIAIYKDYIVR